MQEIKDRIDELFYEYENRNYSLYDLQKLLINYLYKKVEKNKMLSIEDIKIIEILFK